MHTALTLQDMIALLHEHLAQSFRAHELQRLTPWLDALLNTVSLQVLEDLLAYTERDPASKGREGIVLETYASFKAVLYYRLAHPIWQLDGGQHGAFETMGQKLSNLGKILSGAEIHPAAWIGRRFVLDHGFGTVIGETSEIGDDCYILAGVTLGALGIANNPNGKRHPRLGNRVEIGAGARILGPVQIGDNVFISPASVVTHDVPADTQVIIVNQLQLQKHAESGKNLYFNAFVLNEKLHLVGDVMEVCYAILLDANFQATNLTLEAVNREKNHAQFQVINALDHAKVPSFPLNLRVMGTDIEVTLIDPPGLGKLVSGLMQPRLLSIGG
jgi:serine O-acetyltransferase